jgi:Zn-dependent peptidase ImmA (M78 family)
MGTQRALINKATLKLVCDNLKVSSEYINRVTKLGEARIDRWKDPQDPLLPTIRQAKAVAKCLRIPFAGLYLSPSLLPIDKLPNIINKRTLRSTTTAVDDSALNVAIHDLLRLRGIVLDARSELEEPATGFAFSGDLSSVHKLALQIREYLGISYEMQKAASSPRQFFLRVRSGVENKGVMVAAFDGVSLDVARGVALYFDELPVIGINNEDKSSPKTFSILHELVHIVKRQSVSCNEIGPLLTRDAEEIFCNAVAGEALVPGDLLTQEREVRGSEIGGEALGPLAARYSVSREVIARRLLDLGKIQNSDYETLIGNIHDEYEAEQRKPRRANLGKYRPNVARAAFDKNGTSICRVLQRGVDREIYSHQDVGDFLGIKLKHIPRLFAEASRW